MKTSLVATSTVTSPTMRSSGLPCVRESRCVWMRTVRVVAYFPGRTLSAMVLFIASPMIVLLWWPGSSGQVGRACRPGRARGGKEGGTHGARRPGFACDPRARQMLSGATKTRSVGRDRRLEVGGRAAHYALVAPRALDAIGHAIVVLAAKVAAGVERVHLEAAGQAAPSSRGDQVRAGVRDHRLVARQARGLVVGRDSAKGGEPGHAVEAETATDQLPVGGGSRVPF